MVKKTTSQTPVFNPHQGKKKTDFFGRMELNEVEWKDKRKTVVPGQSPSLPSLLHKIQMGIPVKTSSRVVESYFRNNDLTDIDQMSRQFKELKQSIDKKVQLREQYNREQHEKQKAIYAQVEKLMQEQQQQSSPNP